MENNIDKDIESETMEIVKPESEIENKVDILENAHDNLDFNYKNVENRNMSGGKKMVRKVQIKNGKGYKSVSHYKDGKKNSGTRRKLKSNEISLIKLGKFIPGLFDDCMKPKVKKTRKNSKK